MTDALLFVLLGICAVSLIACFVLVNHILQALSKKETRKVERMCGRLTLSLVCGGLSLSSYVALDTLKKVPHLTIGLILLKIVGAIGPFAIGGGYAVYMFYKAAKK